MIRAGAGIGTASSQRSGLFRSGSFGWTFAPQIILPVLDGGRNQANLDADQLRAQAARATAEQDRLKLVVLRCEQGTANAFERLDAQRATFATRQAVVLLQLQQAQSLVGAYKVLGDGWKD